MWVSSSSSGGAPHTASSRFARRELNRGESTIRTSGEPSAFWPHTRYGVAPNEAWLWYPRWKTCGRSGATASGNASRATSFMRDSGRSVRMLPVGQATTASSADCNSASEEGCAWTKDLPLARPYVEGAIQRHVSQSMHDSSTNRLPAAFASRRRFACPPLLVSAPPRSRSSSLALRS
eukprot:363445-Prymnesium_polylepis.1